MAQGAAAVSASPSASESPNVLRIGWTIDPDNLNPFIGIEATTQEIFTLNYDYLTDFDPATLAPRPRLAESWQESADHLEWTFTLRSGAKWQDGLPVTARDVAFTYEYVLRNHMSQFAGYAKGIKSVAATNESTVVFKLSRPKANMLAMVLPILPQHIWSRVDPTKAGTSYLNKPPIVGSGPFQVVEVKKGAYVRMAANKHYWGGAPKIDELIFMTYQNATTMAEDLKLNTLDGAAGLPPAMASQFSHDPRFAYADSNPFRLVTAFGFNCYDSPASLGNPVLKDPEFRRAMNYAVDKQKLIDVALSGHGVPAETLIISDYYSSPDWHWQPPSSEFYGYDPAKASAALDAAGYRDVNGDGWRENKAGESLALRFWTLKQHADLQSIGKMITAELRDLGLNVQFTVMDEGALTAQMWNFKGDTFAPDFDMFLWGWSGDIDPDFILSVFTTGQIGNWSDCNWSNAEYDRLYRLQGSQIDPSARQQSIWQMQQLLYRESPEIFIAYPGVISAWNVERWQGWVRAPKGDGHAFGTQYFDDSYLRIAHASTGDASSESPASLLITLCIVAGLVLVGAVVTLLRRRHRRQDVVE